jgi:hypothetical protein
MRKVNVVSEANFEKGFRRAHAHLVVNDDVDSSSGVKVRDAGHLHCLVDDALPRESGVSMEQNGDDGLSVLWGVPAVELLGSGLSDDEGVHALQVTGVGDETQVDPATVRVGPVHGSS